MSVQAISWAYRQEPPDAKGVKGASAKWVLVTLANYANANDEAYPDPDTTLARDTMLSPRAVRRVLRRLVELELISDSRKREGQTRRVIVWKLHRGNAATVSPLPATAGVDAGQGDDSWRSRANAATVSPLPGGESGHRVMGNAATVSLNADTVSDPPGTPQQEEPKTGTKGLDPTSSAAPRPERRLDPLIELLCIEAELSPGGSRAMTPDAVRTVAVAAAKIGALGGTPELAHLAVVNYPTHFRDATISASAIAKHWARLQLPGPFSVAGVAPRRGPARAADEDWSDIPADAWGARR